MSPTVSALDQALIDEQTPRIRVQTIREKELSPEIFDDFFASSPQSQSIGLSPAYSSGSLNTLAVANASNVLLIQFSSGKSNRTRQKLLEERVLCRPYGNIVAFDLAPLALALFSNHSLRLINGVDIQSSCGAKNRYPITSIKLATGDTEIFEENIIIAFRDMEYDPERTRELSHRAWISQYVAHMVGMEDRFEKARKVNTVIFTEPVRSFRLDRRFATHRNFLKEMDILAKFAHHGLRLDMKKPQQVLHNATTAWDGKESKIKVSSGRFQTRMREPSAGQVRYHRNFLSATDYFQSTFNYKSIAPMDPIQLLGKLVGRMENLPVLRPLVILMGK